MNAPSAPTAVSAPPARARSGGAFFVAAGIFLSRIVGLARTRVFAHYFGSSVAADAYSAALRIPNVLQNLFGEGVLSASFIPVYAALVGRHDKKGADEVAGAIFGLLALTTGVLVGVGIVGAPLLTSLIVPGFTGEARELTIRLVRIMFPGVGILVLSAWCLGILNSHRRFFISYVAPVVWNLAIIVAMVMFGGRKDLESLVIITGWGTVVGGFLQFGVQLPLVMQILGTLRPTLATKSPEVRQVLRSFLPVLGGRGVVQLSAYLDQVFGSFIAQGAVAMLQFAQMIYLLPVSLFGMAVSAAELPAMSQDVGTHEDVSSVLRQRLERGLRRIAFFVIPSTIAFLFLGDIVAGTLLQTGRFGPGQTRFLWFLLAGGSVGLLVGTLGRLYASAFYALKDPRTPLVFASLRVFAAAGLALVLALGAPRWLGLPRELGTAGIPLASGLAGWIEYSLLRHRLCARIGQISLGAGFMGKLWSSAIAAGAFGLFVKLWLVRHYGSVSTSGPEAARDVLQLLPAPAVSPLFAGAVILTVYGAAYFALTAAMKVPEGAAVFRRVLRRR